MKSSRIIGAVITLVALTVSTACSGHSSSPTAAGANNTESSASGSASGATGGATAGRTFTYDTYTTVMTGWDPATSYSNEIIAMSNMYETLTRYDDQTQTVKPLLATSWTSSDQGKTWTFKLRSGVTFHSGRPLTSQAAKAAIERTIKLNQGAAYIWGAVAGIDTPDADTLVFHLKYASPLDLISSADYAAYIYDTEAAGSGDLAKWFDQGHDAGTGPYMAGTWKQGQEIELTQDSYPKYWGGWSGAHYEHVVYRVVSQATTAAQLLQSGQVNYVEQLTPELWKSMGTNTNVTTTSRASWQNLFAFFNTTKGPLADVRVRQAVAYGIDYDGSLAALKGASTRTPGIVPKGLVGYSDSLSTYTHDAAKATALLAAAGYGPGKKALDLSMTYTSGDSNEELVATLMKSSLATLNIDLQVKALQWPTQWAQAKSDNTAARQDIFMMYWWPDYADPYSWFINLFHTEQTPVFNMGYYSNPTLDKQIDSVESALAVNKDEGAQLYITMQKELYDAVPAVVLYTVNYQRALLKSVQGYVDNPAYPNVVFAYDLHPSGA